jgi:hypothetical protein
MKKTGNLTINVIPEWERIDTVRKSTREFLLNHKLEDDDTDAVVMIASELAENAIKYGNFDPDDTIRFSVEVADRKITVEVENRIDRQENVHWKNLDKTIQWIRGFQTPFQAYIERLKLVSTSKIDESGLGLVRIAYEGQGILDFFINRSDQVAVSAVYQLQGANRELQ